MQVCQIEISTDGKCQIKSAQMGNIKQNQLRWEMAEKSAQMEMPEKSAQMGNAK